MIFPGISDCLAGKVSGFPRSGLVDKLIHHIHNDKVTVRFHNDKVTVRCSGF
jgi:hypothetical protein